ncbi:hypothetical protein [Mangrovihabitans endophyticus]|uniref:Uncharacterized protein n=1 Tax=Mangrovihabitans endophyticus TaxID=1751298 RepID=A0A8J3C0E1_9ACTN|nr:hypothetical protein [Mangrovihabitans endophyticus]GGK89085.1 hypothetical protein GCM10012284_23910 [Mangrovihabitans endophyticus]
MASWSLVPCLVSLRNEFNRLAPGRDHASDGSIGDSAHAQSSSDHNPDETGRTPYSDADNINEVHAIDVDDDLRKAGWNMQRCVDIIVGRHRSGKDNRLQYVIYNRRIWSRSWGWTARVYTGMSPHTEHAHFSARYGSGSGNSNPENNTSPWGLLAADKSEDDLPTPKELLAYDPNDDADGIPNPFSDKKTNKTISVRTAFYNSVLIPMQIKAMVSALVKAVDALGTQAGVDTKSILAAVDEVDDRLAAITDDSRDPAQVADALRAVLGDRAAAVGELLAES